MYIQKDSRQTQGPVYSICHATLEIIEIDTSAGQRDAGSGNEIEFRASKRARVVVHWVKLREKNVMMTRREKMN